MSWGKRAFSDSLLAATFNRNSIYMRRILVIDLGRCSDCQGCIEIAPDVFRYNEATGRMEVVDPHHTAEEVIWEAIKNCPKDCIYWEDID